jgi:hypothetical protein
VVGLEGCRRLDVAPLTGLVLWAVALPMSRALRAAVIISSGLYIGYRERLRYRGKI